MTEDEPPETNKPAGGVQPFPDLTRLSEDELNLLLVELAGDPVEEVVGDDDDDSALATRDPDPGVDLSEYKLENEIEHLKHELREVRDTHVRRMESAVQIFWLIVWWLIFVGGLLFLSLIGNWVMGHTPVVASEILVTLLGTTSATVIGLYYIVAKWLYPSPKNGHVSDSKTSPRRSEP